MEIYTTKIENEKTVINSKLTKKEFFQQALFVLDQGWGQTIGECARAGASIILPNLALGPRLLAQTILRQGNPVIATSTDMWDKIKDALAEYPSITIKMKVVLFEADKPVKICMCQN